MLNILTHYTRRFLDSYRDTIRVISHFNLIKLNGKKIIFKIAFIRFVYSFSFIRNLQKTSYKNKKMTTHFFKDKDIDLFNDIKQVDEKGYSKIFTIKDSLKEELLKIVFNCKELDVKKLDLSSPEIFKKSFETIDQYVTRLKKKNISKITGYIDLKTSSALKDFLTSEEILSFVKNYLNTNEISINASFFISNPVTTSERQKLSNAQYFHWDNDFKKFLKLYIYLTDVGHENGPHIYVEESHKFKKFEHRLSRPYPDSSIYSSYSKIKEFTGKSGSSFFVDSYGLHKGKVPEKNSRILLNIHFGSGKILYSGNDIHMKINNSLK